MKRVIVIFTFVLIGFILSGSVYMFYKHERYKNHGDTGKSSVTIFKPVSGRQARETHSAAQNESVKKFIEASKISPALRAAAEEIIVEQSLGNASPEVAKLLISNDYEKLGTELLEEALRQKPLDADTLLTLGSIYRESGRLKEFSHIWESILTTYPESLDLYVALAQFYTEALDVEKGLSILERGVNNNPINNEFRFAMGDWLEIQGLNVEAEQEYADALAHPPQIFLKIQQKDDRAVSNSKITND
jgi:tetratricopeptide (TPR) repeat protein